MGNNRRVIAYLCKKRGLEYSLVCQLLKDSKLYQDRYGNCAFVVRNIFGDVLGAELHGTGDERFKGHLNPWHGYGFEVSDVPDEYRDYSIGTVCYFESAIDLLSFWQIYRNSGICFYLLVSMGGLSSFTVEYYQQLYRFADHLLFVDHDQAGRNFAMEMHMKVKYPPRGKDWNEYLQIKLTE